MKQYLYILIFIISILYGTSYQQFRHFDVDDPRGMDDSRSYIKMSKGDFNVNPVHRYRFVVPYLAGKVYKQIHNYKLNNVFEKNVHIKLSFYIVNFIFITLSAFLLYLILEFYGFSAILSLVGITIFLSSRVIVYTTATPLVDSFFIFSITLIFYLMIKQDLDKLSLFAPILILAKETVIPWLLLPLIFHSKFRNPKYIFSLMITLIIFVASRKYIDSLVESFNVVNKSFFEVIMMHIGFIKNSLVSLFTFQGIFNFTHGFGMLFIFMIHGIYINYKTKKYNLPNIIFILIGLMSIGFALLSGNLGRMIFISFIPIIIYILISIEDYLGKIKVN